jgi:hypothetical protein
MSNLNSNNLTAVASTAPVTATAQANTATAVSVSQLFATDDVQNVATSVLADLEGTRKFWENGALKASNQALYAVLADCLKFCGDLNDGKKNKARNKALEQFHAERNYPYSADSTLATKVVRAVFGNIHRSRINTYALVVNAAKAAKVEPDNMANWIEAQGGVQEIKVAKGENTVPRAEKIAKGRTVFEARPELATVKSEELAQLADNTKAGAECVILAEQNSDGTFTVKALSYKDGLVKTALTALYADEKAAALKQAKEQKAA